MPDTMQQIIAGVRVLLRKVSDIKLPDDDIKQMANDLLRGYTQDLDLSARDHKTRIVEVEFDEAEMSGEYYVSGVSAPDFEPEKLEYSLTPETPTSWREAHIVPLATWSRQMNEGYVAASFYDWNKRVRLNLTCDEVCGFCWKLTYREPLLTVVQTGGRPLLPSNHLPMFKRELAIACIPLVVDESDEWIKWTERTLILWEAELGDRENPKSHTMRGRWRDYLDDSVEPQIQTVKPYDSFRRAGRVNKRGYLPMQ